MTTTKALLFIFLCFGGTAISCGSEDNPVSAPEKCNTLIVRLCERALACANDGTTQAQCVAAAKKNIDCDQAIGTSNGYPACVMDLEMASCAFLIANNKINLPASCTGAILLKK